MITATTSPVPLSRILVTVATVAAAILTSCGSDARQVHQQPSHVEACTDYAAAVCDVRVRCDTPRLATCVVDTFDLCQDLTTIADLDELQTCVADLATASCTDINSKVWPDSC